MFSPCRHCGKQVKSPEGRRGRGSRGLCWSCYRSPARELYPKQDRHGPCPARGKRQPDFCRASPPVPPPTAALPGTPEKVAVLEQRAKLKQALWSPGDNGMQKFLARLAVRAFRCEVHCV